MTDALNHNVSTALEIVNQRLEEKKAKRLDARAEAQRAQNLVEEFDRVIEKLEADRASLERVLGISIRTPIVPSFGAVVPDEVVYDRAFIRAVRGTSSWHDIYSVLVTVNGRKETIVLECTCPAFRFTKGELRNGKTCKHIARIIGTGSRGAVAVAAKKALRSEGKLTGLAPRLSRFY